MTCFIKGSSKQKNNKIAEIKEFTFETLKSIQSDIFCRGIIETKNKKNNKNAEVKEITFEALNYIHTNPIKYKQKKEHKAPFFYSTEPPRALNSKILFLVFSS